MKNLVKLSPILFIALLLWSCQDTCNNKYGATFTNVTFESLMTSANSQNLNIKFNTTTLAELPENYFNESYIRDVDFQSPAFGVDTFYTSKNDVEIILDADVIPNAGSNKDFVFYLDFNDRRTYLDCTHPGMNDSYTLKLEFRLTNNASVYEISNFIWKEEHSAGAI